MNQVKITTEYITLGQFLKYVNIIEKGSFAKSFLQEIRVLVNDEVETRRGRKIYPNYIITIPGKGQYLITK
ncbi:MAG: S4 domain-containing protein YaaA [Acholeplasmataceae bacterium]|nr:S4 domain-containing protein YaaA [Acholeplasmataceae bacterium]HOA63490.1 S4 domain-containing protein YaaA [Bacilli bacterium]HQA19197.1 S4 domain-containing protein YaaA [Bacilli bacterium]HQD91905.1 S4 domain-containing protein YaaA [Bacilli bacterium]